MDINFLSIVYIIWGIALGLLFKRGCVGRNCIIFRAPPRKEMNTEIFKFKDKCYSFKELDTKCNKNPIKE